MVSYITIKKQGCSCSNTITMQTSSYCTKTHTVIAGDNDTAQFLVRTIL